MNYRAYFLAFAILVIVSTEALAQRQCKSPCSIKAYRVTKCICNNLISGGGGVRGTFKTLDYLLKNLDEQILRELMEVAPVDIKADFQRLNEFEFHTFEIEEIGELDLGQGSQFSNQQLQYDYLDLQQLKNAFSEYQENNKLFKLSEKLEKELQKMDQKITSEKK